MKKTCESGDKIKQHSLSSLMLLIVAISAIIISSKPELLAQVIRNTQINPLAEESDFNFVQIKTKAIEEANSKIGLINSLQLQCNAADLQNECQELQRFKNTLETNKQRLLNVNGEEIFELTHDNVEMNNDLPIAQVKARLELPGKIALLSSGLEQLSQYDSKLPSSDRQKLGNVRTKISQTKNSLARLSAKQKFTSGANNVKQFVKNNERNLKDADAALKKLKQRTDMATAQPLIKEARKTLLEIQVQTKILSAIEAQTASPLTANVVNIRARLPGQITLAPIKILVLATHWTNEPSNVESGSTLRRKLNTTSLAFREFFYNRRQVNFDLCEITPDMEQPATYSETVNTMIQLCDSSVDFTRYDYLYFYPLGNGGAAMDHFDFETDDGAISICGGFEIGRISRRTIMHEIGHCMKLRHAKSYDCGSVTWSSATCSDREYGDAFDLMGSYETYGHYNAAHKKKLGVLGDVITVAQESNNITAIISALETASSTTTRPKAIKIPVNKPRCTDLYIEYRKPVTNYSGDNIYEGLAVHCVTYENDTARHINTRLLDCTPNSRTERDFFDAMLTVGNSCTINFETVNYSITFQPLSSNRAQVNIRAISLVQIPQRVAASQPTLYLVCVEDDGGSNAQMGSTVRLVDSTNTVRQQISDSCTDETSILETTCNSRNNSNDRFLNTVINCSSLATNEVCIDPDDDGARPAYCGPAAMALPDLTIQSVAFNASRGGTPIITIANTGNVPATLRGPVIEERFMAGIGENLYPVLIAGNSASGALNAGETRTVYSDNAPPESATLLRVTIDLSHAIAELSEDNNVLEVQIPTTMEQ